MIFYLLLFNLLHDFHFSRVEMMYNNEEQMMEVTAHVFIDDLELAITGGQGEPLHLGTEKEAEGVDTLILAYFQQHLQLSHDGQIAEWQWLGKEVSDDLMAYWVYIYTPWNPEWSLTCTNTIFNNEFDDQKNLLEVNKGEEEYHHLFDTRKTSKQLW
jgi:hypothetical protein